LYLKVDVYTPPRSHLLDNNMIDVGLHKTRENKYLWIETQLIFIFACFYWIDTD